MLKIEYQRLTGERALFMSRDIEIQYCIFADGESPLKESSNLEIRNSLFQWKYPLWYSKNVSMEDSTMFEMARAGIWYTDSISMKNVTIEAPKAFRRCRDVKLNTVNMLNASETLWNCSQVMMKNVTAKGDYFAMGCSDMDIDGFTLVGNYSFDGVNNLTIRNANMLSKDAFWNCENVTVYDSFISGEYIGWNSKNITFINCTIESLQGMCYIENIVLKDCKLLNTTLAFEYSTVEATINSKIDSVRNPISGTIEAELIEELIFDDSNIKREDTKIMVTNETIAEAI